MRSRSQEAISSTSGQLARPSMHGTVSITIDEDYIPASVASTLSTGMLNVALTASSFMDLTEKLPCKTKAKSIFEFPKKHQKAADKSFHLVEQVKKKNGSDATYFFKHNKRNSPTSELEATACHFYQLLIPDYIPSAHAHIDDNDPEKPFIGISSKGIPNFKSNMHDSLVCEDLQDPKIVKGLACGMMASFIFGEDDLHRGNMTKCGERIDFDMSLWPLLCKYKDAGIIDWTFRFPSDASTQVTNRDIENFPDLVDAKPFYWPTKPQPYIPEKIYQTLSKIMELSQNSFKERDNKVYSSLKNIPDFKYFKYRTLLKFILTDSDIYENIAKLHVRSDKPSLIKELRAYQENRIKQFKTVLLNMEEFKDYILCYGKKMHEEIIGEFQNWNNKASRKISKHPEYQHILINIDKIRSNYNDIVEKTQESIHTFTL